MRTRGHLAKEQSVLWNQIGAIFSSHGEMVLRVLQGSLEHPEGSTIIMDEPDMALSCRSAVKLVKVLNQLAEKGQQVIASVHNPIAIASFEHVLSMEHRQWMLSRDFLEMYGVSIHVAVNEKVTNDK